MRSLRASLLVAFVLVALTPAMAQDFDQVVGALEINQTFRLVPDITYLRADDQELKLDLIAPRDPAQPLPTLLYFHGGGWMGGDKDASLLALMPWVEMGWAVVNVEYRFGGVALAPAAVEDCRCALRWVLGNAEEYGLDPNKIVTSGHSAGGHLSLTTAMLPAAAGLDRRCPAVDPQGGRTDADLPEMRVAGVVNWFGITDVADLIDGPDAKTYAVAWLGSQPDREAVARRVSPLEYVRTDLPPILTIHGDADPIVPYAHAQRLHAALEEAGVPNQLHTVGGGGHGGFSYEENIEAFRTIVAFLERYLTGAPTASSGAP